MGTRRQLETDLRNVKAEMELNQFHAWKHLERVRELYPQYCIALARLLDHIKQSEAAR